MPDHHNKLVGNTLKYPYLVGISPEAGNFGTGILISARFVLTCNHVLDDSPSVEVISGEGSTSARVQKVDRSLDLALLDLARPISAPNPTFKDSPLKPGATVLVAGVQATPGQPDQLSVAEIELKFRNKNIADGKVLDIQLEGGARPGYSGGPVLVEKDGALLCVGVMRLGGAGASITYANGLASIRAFVADYIPKLPGDTSGTNPDGRRRLLILTTILFGTVGTIAGWHYLAPIGSKGTVGTVSVATRQPVKTPSVQPTPGIRPPVSVPKGRVGNHNLKTKDSARLIESTPTVPVKLPSANQANPDVLVWVNTPSSVYHCPGTRWYGTTKHGEYMTQAEAQKKANRPAYGKVCQ